MNFPELLRHAAARTEALGDIRPEDRDPDAIRGLSILLGLVIDAATDVQRQLGIERMTLGDYAKRLQPEKGI